ncbi:methyl-accepting chemotaxis sensory transducer [Alicyclobacillus hesperidum URH17-3-68]|uniref:methyl-accepting chemotaxis protein n=1 Tax=Alicyclobacillus hesperidum TaxID=89784 RepID=UPI000281B640|nr:HAMP domain-containing methyl-accepting chemotaxis protein [Alicyclobacillus hesperidum]EJY55450.1 methyl-accepting chemotaxis sensory transducer [Alicyclobacillus hesperidum URH17-3-68]
MDNDSVATADRKNAVNTLTSFSLRTKIILIVVLSLIVSAPIANELNRLVRRALPNTHYGVYINTAISIIVSALIITWLVQILAIRPLHGVITVLRDIAAGNLTARSGYRSRDEIGQLAHELNAMAEQLNRLVSGVGAAAEQLAAAAEELAASAEQTGKASEQIAVTVQEVSVGVGRQEERIERSTDVFTSIAQGITDIAKRFRAVSQSVAAATESATAGGSTVRAAMEQMASIQQSVAALAGVVQGLGERSAEIGAIVDVMTRIARQTHLLSLNAAIEAARAGESGRGFAVVADEVRKLAEQSADQATQIAELIESIQAETNAAVESMTASTQEVAAGMDMVRSTEVSFAEIEASVRAVTDHIGEVSGFMDRIANGTEQLQDGIAELTRVSSMTNAGMQTVAASTEEQLASMEEITASSSALTQMAERLQSLVGAFRYTAVDTEM